MTPEDWKEVEKELQTFFSRVELKCDGYTVTLSLKMISQFKNAITVYVNGWFKGEWLSKDCEERRRFMRPVKRYLFSQKEQKKMKKISKRLRKEMGLADPEKSYTYYLPYWTSFASLKRHLIKNNNSIELVREGSKDGG